MMPQPVERLEKTLARVAKEQGVAQERLRRWVSFLALCGVLERAVSEGILDGYNLKGGVALELRFAEGARATKDIDIGVPVERTFEAKSSGTRTLSTLSALDYASSLVPYKTPLIPTSPAQKKPGIPFARQRPGTAHGFIFLSIEDETGISNAIIDPDLYEKSRSLVTYAKFL
jgi:hypothetical protein